MWYQIVLNMTDLAWAWGGLFFFSKSLSGLFVCVEAFHTNVFMRLTLLLSTICVLLTLSADVDEGAYGRR